MNQNRPDNERTTRIVTLDFNGGSHVYRNPELGMNIPVRIAPSGISADRARMLAEALNRNCADSHVRFEVGANSSENASTVRIGRTADFDRYGAFLGLAEGIGEGNAFVLLDDSANDTELMDVIRHETGHILGTLDHGGAGLARYAWTKKDDETVTYIYSPFVERQSYLWKQTTTTIHYNYLTPTSDPDADILVSYYEDGTEIDRHYWVYYRYWDAEDECYKWQDHETEYISKTDNRDAYKEANGIQAKNIWVDGGSANQCTVGENLYVYGSENHDESRMEYLHWQGEEGNYGGHMETDSIESRGFNYVFHKGSAVGCKVSGKLAVSTDGEARQCDAGSISVSGGRVQTGYYTNSNSDLIQTFDPHNGVVENCNVTGGTLSVDLGGIARDIIIKDGGTAVIGVSSYHLYNSTQEELDQAIQDYGYAKATNLIVELGNVNVYAGGELHNVTVKGSMSVYERGKVDGVITVNGALTAGKGAILGGAITCCAARLSDVTPQTTITIKVDLHDYAIANYTETLKDGTLVEYFANFTTRTTRYGEGHKVISVTNGTFDNKDGRFDMRDWNYTFAVDLGSVDRMSVGSVLVDFGGTEKDFDSGEIDFGFPANGDTIPFSLMSDKRRYTIKYSYFQGENDSIIESPSGLFYNSTLFGDAADVLWLEYGWDEEVEYTVDLAPMMSGATEELTITNAETGNETLTDAKIQGATLVVKGGASTADLVVKAEDSEKRDHECSLELIVVPEEIPVIGKSGAKKYSEMLKRMQKDHITQLNDALPYNIHTKLFGMSFDLTNMGVSLTVNWTEPSMTLKLQGKMEWAIGKGTAGTGRQLKLVVDLSGDNYISITSTKGTYSWDLVGELKVPDFSIGKFKFSNMVVKIDKGNSSFSASAYVQLPWIKYAFGGSIGIVDGYLDSMAIGVDSLNVPLGSTGLFLQKIEGGISGIATALNLTFEGTLGLTAGPKFSVEFVDWLGIDNGEYSLCEMTLTGSISTAGDLEGSSSCVILGGLATGGGSAGIKGGELFVTGHYTLLNGCISIEGELHAGAGGITIIGTGTATVPREKIFGPLAGFGMSANVAANVNHSASDSYVMAWQQVELLGNVFTIGFKSTFEGKVTLLGATDLLKEEDRGNLRSLKSVSMKKGISVAAPLLGASEPSASKTVSVNYSGLSLFQFKLSESGANVSLSFDGTEYTRAAINAGLYENMQVVSEMTGDKYITIAVNNAASGDWTMNAYGDADATFGVYAMEGGTQKPVITAITVGEDARSATFAYTLGDLSGLTDVQLSIYRTEKDAGYTGQRLAVIESPAAEGSWEWVMADELAGGDYSFYLMVESEGKTPARSDISAAYTFRTLDLEAPDQIQTVSSEWKSTGTVVTWDESWDDQGVVGYKIHYTTGDEDMAEIDVKTNTFTFDKVPNGTYDFQVAAYDEAGNLSAWSEQQSCLVLTVANAKYKDVTLTEALELAEYESAAGITAGEFAVTAAANSLISGSLLADAGIAGIVENTAVNGTVTLYDGAQGYGLTVNGELTVGGEKPVPEPDITQTVWSEEDGEEGGVSGGELGGEEGGASSGEETESPTETPAQDETVIVKKGAFADGITVKDGGKLTIEAGSEVRNVTVETGGSLALKDNAVFDQVSLAYGTTLTVMGSQNSGTFRLSGDIYTAGTLNSFRFISGGGHKIHFEQYRQTVELLYPDTDYARDDIALLPDMDKLSGKAMELVIDSGVYGSFKIADKAAYFNGTITVTDHVDGSSAEVGFDKLILVGNALCKLRKSDDGTLWLNTVRSEIGAPTVSVEYADSNAHETIYLSATPVENSGIVSKYSYRYSLNEDMSDAVTMVSSSYSGSITLNKDDLVENATYYVQACIENDNGVKSLWSDAVSFTVVPKLRPAAPTTLTVSGATNVNSDVVTLTAGGVDESETMTLDWRFRYADNPEMTDAVVITTGQHLLYYTTIKKSDIEDGKDYYVQAGVRKSNGWSYWSDIVVFNTQGWDYENITVDASGPYAGLNLNGKRAKNVKVIDGGSFYGGGEVDGLTVEAGGFFRDDNATVTNAVVNGGRYWLDTGNATDLVVNGGQLRLMGGTLKGTTVIGADATMDLSSNYTPTITGTILIQGQFTIYYLHPVISTNAEFVFDVGAHEAEAMRDKAFVEYVFALGGASKFTAKLDDTPEIGEYRITSLYQVPEGELYVSLEANDGTKLGTLQVGGALIEYNGLYYSLIDQKGNAYLHVSDNQDPPFIGAVKLYKDGSVYDSNNGYSNLTVSTSSDCDHVLVGDAGQVSSITVGDGGSVDVSGTVFGATIENGGQLTLKEGGRALSRVITVRDGGNVTIEGGKVDLGAAFHLAGGTITVNGALQGWEDDTGDEWGATRHWFVYDLDKINEAPDGAMVSDYTLLQCNPEFTANMSASQKNVSYKLLGNASGFDGYVSLNVEGHDYQEYLRLGQECSIGDSYYSLAIVDDVLTLNVSATRPVHAPTVWADIEEPTTGSVTVTASFDETAKTMEYSLDGVTWKTYKKAVKVTENGTIYFRGKDSKGNTSPVVSYEVTNIEKAGPDPDKPEPKPDDGMANGSIFDDKGNVKESFAESTGTVIGGDTGSIVLDDGVSQPDDTVGFYNNFVGYGDAVDYAKFTLEKAANLSFEISATDAVKFTIYTLDEKTKKLKAVQTTTLKKTDGSKPTAEKLLEAGEYYISMQSTNSKKADAAAFYNVELSTADIYLDGDDNKNDWLYEGGKKGRGLNLDVAGEAIEAKNISRDIKGKQIQVDAKAVEHDPTGEYNNFVGFGDVTDYVKVHLDKAANLSLTLESGLATKVQICQLTYKNGVANGTKALVTASLKAGNGSVASKLKLLEAGDYYVAVTATNAKKGDEAYYNVLVNDKSVFFDNCDDQTNDWLYEGGKKGKGENTTLVSSEGITIVDTLKKIQIDDEAFIPTSETGDWKNFVGYGDTDDYQKINIAKANATASFKVTAKDQAKFVIYSYDKVTHKVKALQTSKLKKEGDNYIVTTASYTFKTAGEYYIAVTSTNAKKGGNAYYTVELVSTNITAADLLGDALAADLALPETASGLPLTDDLSFAPSAADAIASTSASYHAKLDDKSGWMNIASLA